MENLQTNNNGLRPPDTRELERRVLSDLLVSPEMLGQVREYVNGQMFADEKFRRVWDTINEMSDQGATIDSATLITKIDCETIMELSDPTAGLTLGTIDHCRALAEMATRRMVYVRAYEMMRMAGNTALDFSKVLAMPGDLVNDLSGQFRKGASTQSIEDIMQEWADDLLDRAGGTITRVPTGIPGLHRVVYGGWNGGNLVIMAARPSVGKSAVMLQMAIAAGKANFPATVYSLEMPNTEMGQRLCCSTGVLRQRDIQDDDAIKHLEWNKVERAMESFKGVPVYFNTRLRTMDEICNDIVLQHERGRCSVAFIDHLHIISGSGKSTMYQQISERTRRFKTLAMDCNIPIVLLCQLNRMSDLDNRPPELMDLRDSGSIEQDADVVLMLARHTNTKADPDIDMWVRKNRQGKADICIGLTGDVTRGFTVFYERKG